MDFVPGMRECSLHIQSYTYPLLVDVKGVPDLIATCFFLDVAGAVFLVTAAHALRRRHGDGVLTSSGTQLIQLDGFTAATKATPDDPFDVAALRISRDFVGSHRLNAVPESMFAPLTDIRSVQARAICGYPVTKNKRGKAVDRVNRLFTARVYTYFGNVLEESHYARFGKSPQDHVGLAYASPGTDDQGNQLSQLPSPRGISGGGSWLVPDFRRPEDIFLEGLFIECHRDRYAFSTRLEHVIGFIMHTHPAGRLAVPPPLLGKRGE